MGDIFLNHKYTFEELLNSPDPYTLIFANPSPLRGVFDKNNQFQTCEEASRDLKSALALDTQTGVKHGTTMFVSCLVANLIPICFSAR